MSNVSMTLGDTPKREHVHPNVDELCDYILEQKLDSINRVAPQHRASMLPKFKFDGGFKVAQTRDDFERLLSPLKRALSNFMLQLPRDEGESIADYRERLSARGAGDRWNDRLHNMADMLAHIAHIDDEERAARRQADEERKEREREQRAELERAASPDRDELRQLFDVIENARAGERFLAQLSDALNAHRNGEAARKRLHDIFDAQRHACASLNRKLPAQTKVPAAPQGALDIALSIARANAPPQRIYPRAGGSSPMRRG